MVGLTSHARAECFERLQDGDDGLAVFPAHFLDVSNGRDQITRTARAHEQPVPLDEEPSHTDRLSIWYPKHTQKAFISVNHPYSVLGLWLHACEGEGDQIGTQR